MVMVSVATVALVAVESSGLVTVTLAMVALAYAIYPILQIEDLLPCLLSLDPRSVLADSGGDSDGGGGDGGDSADDDGDCGGGDGVVVTVFFFFELLSLNW